MQYEHNIFWNNIPCVSKKLGFLEDVLLDTTFFKNIKNPYYIWTGTGKILPLEELALTAETKNVIQQSDLEFYFFLYEPSCGRVGEHNRSFYSEFSSDVDLKKIIFDEFESIRIFIKNNNIKNFRIFTCDYNINLIKDNYPDLKIHCLDIFLREMSYGHRAFPELKNDISNKFWCGNWRYAPHRHIITSYLVSSEGTYTWNLKCSYEELKKNDWFDLEKFKIEYPVRHKKIAEGVEYLYNNILAIDQKHEPVSVDQFDLVFIPGGCAPSVSDQFLQSFTNSFCAVVNETRYAQPFGYFSEKTLTSMHMMLPVILVAPPFTLEYLKTFGFKTFDKWWDESYDAETDHYRRMIKIFDIIDYINSKSIDELKLIYQDMEETLIHNKKIIPTIAFNDRIL